MKSTKRKVEIEVSQQQLEGLFDFVYPQLADPQRRDNLMATKFFLHQLHEKYYKKRIAKLRLPNLESFTLKAEFEEEDELHNPDNTPFQFRLFEIFEMLNDEDNFVLDTRIRGKFPSTGEFEEIVLNGRNIVCILPTVKGRSKTIYYLENSYNSTRISELIVNSDDYNFDSLVNKFDPLNRFLILVSKSAVVNVRFYSIVGRSKLELHIRNCSIERICRITVSKNLETNLLSGIDRYIIIRNEYLKRVLFQKRILGYMEEFQ